MRRTTTVGVDIREWRRGTSTGIGRVLTSFLGWAVRNTDLRLVLIGNQRSEVRIRSDGFILRRHHQENTLLWDHRVLARILRQEGADVLWSPYYKAPAFCPCPSVVTIHDLIPFAAPSGALQARAPATAARRSWMKFLAGRASRIVTDSEHSKRDLMAILGIEPQKISVIPVGLETARGGTVTAADIDQVRARYGIPARYVLYLGRFDPHKNVATITRAWSRLSPELRAGHALVLAGDGSNSVDKPDGTIVTGFVDDTDLPALYSGARAFVFPSCYEGFGLPPLEAMAYGVPVVCSNAASLPEVTGGAALLVDPTDAGAWADTLARVLTDDELRAHMIADGKCRADTFDPSHTSPRLARLLVDAAAGS